MTTRFTVRKWMREHAWEYETATKLAEAAVRELFLPDRWLDDETHWLWEIAASTMDQRDA